MMDARSALRAGARRWAIRRTAASLAALTAGVYFLIGFDVIVVTDPGVTGPGELLGFGVAAGVGFGLAAALLASLDWRPLWVFGAVMQLLVMVMYVAVASERVPPFEFWGIALRVPQTGILAALLYLSLYRPQRVGPTGGGGAAPVAATGVRLG